MTITAIRPRLELLFSGLPIISRIARMTTGKPEMRTVIPMKGGWERILRERKNTVCHLKTISFKKFFRRNAYQYLIIITFDNIFTTIWKEKKITIEGRTSYSRSYRRFIAWDIFPVSSNKLERQPQQTAAP